MLAGWKKICQHACMKKNLTLAQFARLGGQARQKSLNAREKKELARRAAQARWARRATVSANALQEHLTDAEKQFSYYASKWKEETEGDSSLTNITGNMNYLRIIRMGDQAIPLILRELERESAPWFVALMAITGIDSVGRNSPGNFDKMADAWIQWGKEHGYSS
jgi:hypothetical protein